MYIHIITNLFNFWNVFQRNDSNFNTSSLRGTPRGICGGKKTEFAIENLWKDSNIVNINCLK
ncbi:protein of unknown function [Clostridium beijerinckii]|nr:protein of unknown function [Clostridium beijerinckii]